MSLHLRLILVRFNDKYVPLKPGKPYFKPERGTCRQFKQGGDQPPVSLAPRFWTSRRFVLSFQPAVRSFVTYSNRWTYFHPPLSGAVTLGKEFLHIFKYVCRPDFFFGSIYSFLYCFIKKTPNKQTNTHHTTPPPNTQKERGLKTTSFIVALAVDNFCSKTIYQIYYSGDNIYILSNWRINIYLPATIWQFSLMGGINGIIKV